MTTDSDLRAHDDGTWLQQAQYCTSCRRWIEERDGTSHELLALSPRLWFYTNYDCNLACSYCLVSSSPYAERREISAERFEATIEEARHAGIREVFLTGGEPFLLPSIFDMLASSTRYFATTVLSNAMLLRGSRLERLAALNSDRLAVQVSLDDSQPEVHDAYRGDLSWQRTIDGIRGLQSVGIRVRIATTVSPEAEARVPAVRRFVRDELQIPESDHIVRPLLRRGFADLGLEVGRRNLVPELTVDAHGFYWHPAGTDADLLITSDVSSLKNALEELARQVKARGARHELQPFR